MKSKTYLSGLVAFCVIGCGGVKTTGGNGKDAGTEAEKQTEQPTEVTGGFGLNCISADNPTDPLKMDFTCAFATETGQKFQERPDSKLDVKVKIGEDIIAVEMNPAAGASNFTFTVAKLNVRSTQICAKFVNPKDGNKVLSEKSSRLSEVYVDTPPTFTIKLHEAYSSPISSPFFWVKITSSEAVIRNPSDGDPLEISDVSVVNGALSDWSFLSNTSLLKVTPLTAGEVKIKIDRHKAQDFVGIYNDVESELVVTYSP